MATKRGKYRNVGEYIHNGEKIQGLKRRPDGRFYSAVKPTKTFGTDPSLAIHKFRRWLAQQEPDKPFPLDRYEHLAYFDSPDAIANTETERIRNLILTDPKQAAVELDIPYLADYPAQPKAPTITLEQLGERYIEEKRNKRTGRSICPQEQSQSRQWWKEFLNIINVTNAKSITKDMIAAYEKSVMRQFDKGMSPTYVKHRFGKIKAIMSFAIKNDIDSEEFERVLRYCKILIAPASKPPAPKPIHPKDFAKLLRVANKKQRAILLLALNCCLHRSELIIGKGDIDLEAGTFVSARTKTGVVRAAVLWARTVTAVRSYQRIEPNTSEFLFLGATGLPINGPTITRLIHSLRKKAKVPHVEFCMIRDGAYTHATDGGIPWEHAQVLAGHKTSLADRYILRNPTMVADSCEAIERQYFSQD